MVPSKGEKGNFGVTEKASDTLDLPTGSEGNTTHHKNSLSEEGDVQKKN